MDSHAKALIIITTKVLIGKCFFFWEGLLLLLVHSAWTSSSQWNLEQKNDRIAVSIGIVLLVAFLRSSHWYQRLELLVYLIVFFLFNLFHIIWIWVSNLSFSKLSKIYKKHWLFEAIQKLKNKYSILMNARVRFYWYFWRYHLTEWR